MTWGSKHTSVVLLTVALGAHASVLWTQNVALWVWLSSATACVSAAGMGALLARRSIERTLPRVIAEALSKARHK